MHFTRFCRFSSYFLQVCVVIPQVRLACRNLIELASSIFSFQKSFQLGWHRAVFLLRSLFCHNVLGNSVLESRQPRECQQLLPEGFLPLLPPTLFFPEVQDWKTLFFQQFF